MFKLINFVFRLFFRNVANFFRYIKLIHYRLAGIQIGRNTMISLGAKIDTHKGKIIIGDNCLITHGSHILSHDGSLRLINPGADRAGTVVIGNNVFIGVNAIVLMNVTVGDNSVIGAGAVVTKNVPSFSVVTGNPAKVIKTLSGPFQVLNNPK